MDVVNQQMLALIGRALAVYVGVIVIFLLLTRNSSPRTNAPLIVRLSQPILLLCGLFTIFVIGGLLILILVMVIPDNPVTAAFPAITRDTLPMFINQFPDDDDAFMLPFIIITIAGLGGSVWLVITAYDRLQRKTYDDPGDIISRILRWFSFMWHAYFTPALSLAVIMLIVRYDTRLTKNIETLPALLSGKMMLLTSARSSKATDPNIILIVLPLIALVLLVLIIRQFLFGLSTYGWATTDGTITLSRIAQRRRYRRRGSTFPTYYHELRYDYRVGVSSKELTGTQLNTGFESAYYFRAYAWQQIQRYPEGAPVTVYFNPQRPSNAVLIRGVDWYSITSRLLMLVAASMALFVNLFQARPM